MSGQDEWLLPQRQVESQRAFFRMLGAASDGSRIADLPGDVQAVAAPVRPWYSIFNSVVYKDPDAALGQLEHLTQFYREAGSQAWGLWVPPWDNGLDDRLLAAGLRLDSTPMLMAATIDETDLEPQFPLTLAPAPSARVVAAVNDQAHGVLAEWSMTAVFERADEALVRPYVALVDGEPACALFALEADGDCYFWFVATAPQFRGRGLASELVRHALRAAQTRGCTTTTLESTAMAESTYARLGFRPYGRYRVWEWRAG